MKRPFKYITKFTGEITASSSVDDPQMNITEASLESLRPLIPDDIDFEQNVDLVAVAFNAAVVNMFNKNGDGIDTETALAVVDYFNHKPTNVEHERDNIVGHIVSSSFSTYADNKILSKTEASGTFQPFNISLAAVLYKMAGGPFAQMIEMMANAEGSYNEYISASWEVGFNDYVIAVGSKNLSECEIITEANGIKEYSKFLKCNQGEGKTKDGSPVYRLLSGDVYPLGVGFTTNPAADVKGIHVEKSSPEKQEEKEEDYAEYKNFYINNLEFLKKIKNNKEIISQCSEEHVKTTNTKKVMENSQLIEEFTKALKDVKSEKSFSDEAVANLGQIFRDAIKEKNEQYVEEIEQAKTEKESLLKAQADFETKVFDLEGQLKDTKESLSQLEEDNKVREAAERFQVRMAAVNEIYQLSEDDSKILVAEIKSLDESEESFSEYQEKLAVVWAHKNKEHIAKQEESLKEKIDEEVEKRLAELSTASEEAATEEVTEEVVDSALENAEETDEVVANNNAEVSEEELTLKQKFKQAFTKEHVTVNY
tara:strand:+ start:1005 stop:2621 length:1617 start_codon:yes stop_codon:yes gene_type:complete